MMFLAQQRRLWRLCEVATIGIERFGSRLGHVIVGWKAPKSSLRLTNLFAAPLEQKAGVAEAWR
jgi:hypothetical protein